MRFTRKRSGTAEAKLDAVEADVLSTIAADLLELLGGEDDGAGEEDPLAAMVGLSSGPAQRPDDPALARLLPDAYRPDASDDPRFDAGEAAAEFRRYTQAELRSGKRAAAVTVLETLAALDGPGRLRLDRDQADAWLGTLNDLRLVLGSRLDVTDDTDLQAPPDDPDVAHALQVYGWLGWLQETLLDALDPRPS